MIQPETVVFLLFIIRIYFTDYKIYAITIVPFTETKPIPERKIENKIVQCRNAFKKIPMCQ
jgi:hypothetical protein